MLNKYSALFGKTHAMFGKLLTTENYYELMRQKNVINIAAFLKYRTDCGKAFDGIDESEIHRAHLENVIRKSFLDHYRKLSYFTSGNIKGFLKIAYLKHEIESLKRLFRVLEMEGDTAPAQNSLLFLKKYDMLNLENLAATGNTKTFISNLEGTEYYHVLRPFLSEAGQHNLFHIEMALDMYYINLINRKKKQLLTGLDAKIADHSIGTEIDVLNLMWIYRARIAYNLDGNAILRYLIPGGYKLSAELLRELVRINSRDGFLAIIGNTEYSNLFLSEPHGFFELNFSEYMYRMHSRFFRKYGFSIAAVLSYLHLKECELSNIISIIEGIRYGLPVDRIKSFVVGIAG
ncbi:MAG TPA: V-type ATPase subunit [Clostridia bacterium]